MSFKHFTRPDGGVVLINPDQVAEVKPPIDGEAAVGARAIIVLESGAFQTVRETVDQVEEKLK